MSKSARIKQERLERENQLRNRPRPPLALGGFLLFIIFMLYLQACGGLLGLGSLGYQLLSGGMEGARAFLERNYPGSASFGLLEYGFSALAGILSLTAAERLRRRSPRAVRFARLYVLLLCLGSGIISLLRVSLDIESANDFFKIPLARELIQSLMQLFFFFYLSVSFRVRQTYPDEFPEYQDGEESLTSA